jgi:hypothetical protein
MHFIGCDVSKLKLDLSNATRKPGKEYLPQSGTKKGPQHGPFSMVAENVYLKVIWLSMVSPSGVNFISVRERSNMST